MTKSAPDAFQSRNPNKGLPYHQPTSSWKSETQIQLPHLANQKGLRDFILTTSNSSNHQLLSTSHSSAATSKRATKTLADARSLTEVRSGQLYRDSPPKAINPLLQAFKLTQASYASSRVKRMLDNKLRAYENESLAIEAQSYSKQDTENILEIVEQSQQRVCQKDNGSRRCGICPNTAKSERHVASDHLNLNDSSTDNRVSATLSSAEDNLETERKKELVIQLPNITYSRANTPGAAALTERVTLMAKHVSRLDNSYSLAS